METFDDKQQITTKTALLQPNKLFETSRMKFGVGVLALVLVDIIWVASSQLTRYLFKNVDFDKPYMSTYIKISMFTIYLSGFVFYSPWRRQCLRCACDDYPGQYQLIGETDTEDTDDGDYTIKNSMSESIYVPAHIPSTSDSCGEGEKQLKPSTSRVKFNNLMEVKHLEDCQDAQIARMNYGAALRAKLCRKSINGRLSLTRVMKIGLFFTFVFFLGNLSYQEALAVEKVAIVNIFSATSGIFTLILATLFPSGPTDKFTFTKLFAVLLSTFGGNISGFQQAEMQGIARACVGIARWNVFANLLVMFPAGDISVVTSLEPFSGIVVVSVASSKSNYQYLITTDNITTGALWAILGSFCYAIYLVLFKKAVGEHGKVDVPMFFGFVGLFCLVLLWPGLIVFHYIHFETFELPTQLPALLLVVNGLIGTVLSELLWLWGCLATSSLMGTLSLSMTIPLSILTDVIFRKIYYSWLFYVGTTQVFLAFILVSYLSHKNPTRDPLLEGLKKLFCCCFYCPKEKTRHGREQEIPLTLFNDEEED